MGLDMVPLVAAFTFVFLAELGDKTQIAAIILSSKCSAASVFAGSMLAFFLVDGMSALIGGELIGSLPYRWISLSSGVIFVIFGVLSFIRRDEKIEVEDQRVSFFKTFSVVSLMELGDKTQIASIVLAGELESPFIVLAGIMLAFSLVTGIGVLFGRKLLRMLPEKYLKMGASLLFVLFGVIFILRAMINVALI
ncbi:MAG: putative membrane protein [Candidatus Bathyarchaeota archaeon B26-2]|nr:MAG: putative membrane protein [Candidatus Bathyarchaeota archaeon B26-2]